MDATRHTLTTPHKPLWGRLGAAWGVLGVCALLGTAIARLSPIAWEAVTSPLSVLELLALVVWVLLMAMSEGYRGFQRAFSPRVAARARHLAEHPTPVRVALAPLFCMAFFGAPRRRRVVSFALTLGIVALVVAVRYVAQPWRGIIDAGVVVGLCWGLVATLASVARAFSARGPSVPAEVDG